MSHVTKAGAPWLDSVPVGWQGSRIRNEACLSPGLSGSPPMSEELCTLVPMESVSEFGQINFETRVPYEDVQSSLVSFEAGDVLFAKITPCMENGKGANVVDLPTRYAFGSTEFHVLRPRHTLDAKFLYYCTFNPVYRAYAAENMVGAAGQKRVSSRFLKDSRIFLPTVAEQQRIAGYLDASCRLIDAAVAAKRKQIDAASLIFKAILQRTITRGLANSGASRPTGNAWLPEVPTGWGLVMLKRVCAIHGGLTLGKEYTGELVTRPYLRVANVQDGRLVLEDVSTIDVPVDIAERTRLQTGDVLMTEGGDLDKLGRGVVWRGEIEGCMHQNHVFAVRCTPWKLRPQFLAYVSASQYGRDYFEATGKKTTNLAATNSTKVGQFPIPLPSISEQDEIIEYLDNEDAKARALRSSLDSQIEVLYAYRKSLIHECVTGQRRITDEDVQRVAAHAASAIA